MSQKEIYEIIDDAGVVETPFGDLAEAEARYDEMVQEGFEFQGTVKIVQVCRQYR